MTTAVASTPLSPHQLSRDVSPSRSSRFTSSLASATIPIPEEDSLMSEGFQGDRIQVAVRLRPLPKIVDPHKGRNGSVESPDDGVAPPSSMNPAACLTKSGLLLPGRRHYYGSNNTSLLDETKEAWTIQNNDTIVQKGPGRKTPNRNLFAVDSVFDETIRTSAIYHEIARPIVQSVLSGRHGCLFAYGQTGSGKTYTMQGGINTSDSDCQDEDESEYGLIQLSLYELFDAIEASTSRDWEVKVQYFEIYCEEVRDLLVTPPPESSPRRGMNNSTSLRRKSSSSLASKRSTRSQHSSSWETGSVGSHTSEKNLVRLPSLKVLEDRNGNVIVNAREKTVNSAEECLSLLRRGNRNRASAATDVNQHSSRSHAIFRVTLQSRFKSTLDSSRSVVTEPTARVSVLNLVDLAGSENCNRSNSSSNTRKREGGKINQSLLSLSRCIHALSLSHDQRPAHINFRDSKLTRILQPSLSGNACMAILCCASMSKANVEETRSTLKFASSAKRIEIKPVVNEIIDDKERYSRLQQELIMVKQTLLEFQHQFAATTSFLHDSYRFSTLQNQPDQQIMAQHVVVGRVRAFSDVNSSMGSEETPTLQPPTEKYLRMLQAASQSAFSSPQRPLQAGEEEDQCSKDHDEDLTRRSSSSIISELPPVAEVEILDTHEEDPANLQVRRSSEPAGRESVMDEQRANYLEERIELTESLVERIYSELNNSRHFMLESTARNSELQDQVAELQKELTASDENSSQIVLSGWYFLFCIMLYAFGLREFFISAVIFLWLSHHYAKQGA